MTVVWINTYLFIIFFIDHTINSSIVLGFETAISSLKKYYKALEQDLQSSTIKETVGSFSFITQKSVLCSLWTKDQESGKYVWEKGETRFRVGSRTCKRSHSYSKSCYVYDNCIMGRNNWVLFIELKEWQHKVNENKTRIHHSTSQKHHSQAAFNLHNTNPNLTLALYSFYLTQWISTFHYPEVTVVFQQANRSRWRRICYRDGLHH